MRIFSKKEEEVKTEAIKFKNRTTTIDLGSVEERDMLNRFLYVMGMPQNPSQLIKRIVKEEYDKKKRKIDDECTGEDYALYCKTGFSKKQYK